MNAPRALIPGPSPATRAGGTSPLSHASGRGAGGEGGPVRPVVQVAAGVVVRADGAVLLADRPAGKPYAGFWEFPGGKIEAGESVEQALGRELAEELQIALVESVPWVVFEHDYPHAYVRLHFRRVFGWRGEPTPLEGQRLRFYHPPEAQPEPLLPAARPVMRWLRLPDRLQGFDRRTPAEPEQPVDHWIAGMRWRVATVGSARQLARAAAAGADFAVLGAMADDELAELCRAAPVPVYAQDTGEPGALDRLRRLGAHGLAG